MKLTTQWMSEQLKDNVRKLRSRCKERSLSADRNLTEGTLLLHSDFESENNFKNSFVFLDRLEFWVSPEPRKEIYAIPLFTTRPVPIV